ncbi:MAG: hypothetical protein MJE77_25730 [Proteobacteria bacterium]|nr:hypothetical protein [Pseudomonadota bacterium]
MKKKRYGPSLSIPEHWSPDEALVVASFLYRISQSIWATHGHEMAEALCRSDELSSGAPIPLPNHRDDLTSDDDMPF